MPYDKKQKAQQQKKHRKKMRDAGYKLKLVKDSPKYDTTIKRI